MERLKVQTLSSSKSPAKSPKRPPPPLAARVKVAVRVRPPVASNGNEVPLLCISEAEPETGANADNVIQFKLDKTQKSFRFDHIFSPEATQAEAYKAALQPLLVSLLCGFNVTVLAYGQTGSGKTYTMGGAAVGSGNDDGLILRFLRDLFDALRNEASMKTTIKVSFLEIYCDEIRDLLVERARGSSQNGGRQSSGPKHTIHEDDNDVWIEGLQQVNVKTVNEALNLLKTGRQRQTVGAHALNDQSSRSHAVYTLEVSRAFANEIKRSKLTFVDLAGSERVKKTLLEGHGMKEGSHINIGLLALGNVINALGSRQRPLQRLNSTGVSGRGTGSGNVTPRHVPYRSSKLTRLLRDALGGNSVTLFIACVSPEITNSNETLNTLQYANRARSIQNKAQKNVEEAVTEDMIVDATSVDLVTEREIYALREQVAALRLQLDQALAAAAEARDSSLVDIAPVDHSSSPQNPDNDLMPKTRKSPKSKCRLRVVPLELDLPDYTNVRDMSCSLQRKGVVSKISELRQKDGFSINSSSACTNQTTSGEQELPATVVRELITRPTESTQLNAEILDCNEKAAAQSLSVEHTPQLISESSGTIQCENEPLSIRVMFDRATQYEPLCLKHERTTPVDYVLLSPSEIFREVHNQKVLEGAPSPWPHRRRLDVQHKESRLCSPKLAADINNNDTPNLKRRSSSKNRDVLHDLLRYTRQIVENSPDFGDLDSKPEVTDQKEGQSPLSFDAFVDRMTALYDQRSRQHQFVHRLRQRFRHLASLLDVDNQMNELSKYTLEHQLDSLQQHLTALERLAADRLWTRLQHRETAIENYAGVWSDKLAEIFLSDDQYEACTPWHTHREDHEFFQHRILAFILNGWISVTRSDLENEQLWLAL
ncbi:hypothetical protein PC128_g9979 [Phytophthora cactorum]|nr:hypothetical protein PC128_g9979 [Phytophthora cactorum]KAG4048924.1 hypothetical protein PC123_g15776 [Phytophthora cactorum]